MPEGLSPEWVSAAPRVLAAHGLEGFTVGRVAEEAGVSRVTLHRHGVRRVDLLDALAALAAEDVRAPLWPVLTSTAGAPERFRTALVMLCEAVERHAGTLVALYGVQDPGRSSDKTSGVDFSRPFERLLVDLGVAVEAAADNAELAINAVTWTYLHMRRSHRWWRRQAQEAVVAFTIAAVGTMTTDS